MRRKTYRTKEWPAAAIHPGARLHRTSGDSLGEPSCLPVLLCVLIILVYHAVRSAEMPRTPEHDYVAPLPGSYELPVIKAAADGEVVDSRR